MANNIDESPFSNFSIQDTMEMGMGHQELLKDLMSPETSTAAPDELEKIEPKKEEKPKEESSTSKETKKLTAEDKKKELEEQKLKQQQDLLKDLTTDENDTSDETPKEEVVDESNKTSENQEVTKFEALSKDLFKLNVFTKDEDEKDVVIKTPEEFLERFNYEKKKGAIETVNNFIGQFGEEWQNAFQAIYVNGVHPKEYFNTFDNIQNYSTLDLTKEANQETVIKMFLAEQGFEPEDITTEIEKLKNYGDLETTSQKYHKVLVKKETQKLTQLEEEAKEKLQLQAQVKQQYVQNVQGVLQEKLKAKEFDGIPINPKLATELQDFLITEKWKTQTGETLTDFDRTILELKRPENHQTKVKVALLLKILEKDPTLSTIQKAGISKKTNTLFEEVARQTSKETVKSSKQESPKSWFS